jgi:glutamate--cysteine ligase
MPPAPHRRLSRDLLVGYFLGGVEPRREWKVGMELEKMGRRADDGRPMRYDGAGPTVRKVLELYLDRRGGEPIREGERLIGIDAPWGTITLEPAGQLEWSSWPQHSLARLEEALEDHLAILREAAATLGLVWLDVAVEPEHAVTDMPWMPKSRYAIMRDYFRKKGRLAHRMMTQTAAIQCAFDYANPTDWKRKFRAAANLAPVATAMFANSSRVDGRDSGYRSYRHAIWRQTDDDRCGLPWIVFEEGFGIERWVDWLLDVPLLFRRRGDGLVPPDGSTFRQLLEGPEGPSLEMEDWASHCSGIFTEVRSYTYLEVRSADLQPDDGAFAVPVFWAASLYDDDAVDAALDLGRDLDHPGWRRAMDSAARRGLEGEIGSRSLREVAARSLGHAAGAMRRGIPCGDDGRAVRHLERLASRLGLDLDV